MTSLAFRDDQIVPWEAGHTVDWGVIFPASCTGFVATEERHIQFPHPDGRPIRVKEASKPELHGVTAMEAGHGDFIGRHI